MAKAAGGDAVPAHLEALPRWKRDIGRQLGGLIVHSVSGTPVAVGRGWPPYGIQG